MFSVFKMVYLVSAGMIVSLLFIVELLSLLLLAIAAQLFALLSILSPV